MPLRVFSHAKLPNHAHSPNDPYAGVDGIAEGRLRHYNKVLTEQLQELQHAVQRHEHLFKQQYNLDPHARVTPAPMMKAFVKQQQRLTADTLGLERQLRALAGDDVKYLKRWIREQREMEQEDAVLDAVLAEMGGSFTGMRDVDPAHL